MGRVEGEFFGVVSELLGLALPLNALLSGFRGSPWMAQCLHRCHPLRLRTTLFKCGICIFASWGLGLEVLACLRVLDLVAKGAGQGL